MTIATIISNACLGVALEPSTCATIFHLATIAAKRTKIVKVGAVVKGFVPTNPYVANQGKNWMIHATKTSNVNRARIVMVGIAK